GESDDRGHGEWNGRAAVHGWNGKSYDHYGGLSAGDWNAGRKRNDSAVRVLDEYKRSGSGAGVLEQREHGGAVQRDQRADTQCLRDEDGCCQLRTGRVGVCVGRRLLRVADATGGNWFATRLLLWSEQRMQVGGGY